MTARMGPDPGDVQEPRIPVEECITHAKGRGLAISVEGGRLQYLPYLSGAGTIWIASHVTHEVSHIVSETTVANAVRQHRPDVRLLRAEESAFSPEVE